LDFFAFWPPFWQKEHVCKNSLLNFNKFMHQWLIKTPYIYAFYALKKMINFENDKFFEIFLQKTAIFNFVVKIFGF